MDISLQVLIRPSTHALSTSREARRYKAGSVINIYPSH